MALVHVETTGNANDMTWFTECMDMISKGVMDSQTESIMLIGCLLPEEMVLQYSLRELY